MENPKEEIEAILNEMNFTNTFEVQKELFINGSDFEVSDEEFEEHLNPALYNAYIFDTDLAKEVRDKYEVGQALYQPIEVYASPVVTKPSKNTRYVIYSQGFVEIESEYIDDEYLELYTDLKLSVNNTLDCFKVVDIRENEKLKQITLVEYSPVEENYLMSNKTEIEQRAIKEAEELFNNQDNGESLEFFDPRGNSNKAIGINETTLEFFTKEDLTFLAEFLSSFCDHFGLEESLNLMEMYDLILTLEAYHQFAKDNEGEDPEEIKEVFIETGVHEYEHMAHGGSDLENLLNMGIQDLSDEDINNEMDEFLANYDEETEGIPKETAAALVQGLIDQIRNPETKELDLGAILENLLPEEREEFLKTMLEMEESEHDHDHEHHHHNHDHNHNHEHHHDHDHHH